MNITPEEQHIYIENGAEGDYTVQCICEECQKFPSKVSKLLCVKKMDTVRCFGTISCTKPFSVFISKSSYVYWKVSTNGTLSNLLIEDIQIQKLVKELENGKDQQLITGLTSSARAVFTKMLYKHQTGSYINRNTKPVTCSKTNRGFSKTNWRGPRAFISCR